MTQQLHRLSHSLYMKPNDKSCAFMDVKQSSHLAKGGYLLGLASYK